LERKSVPFIVGVRNLAWGVDRNVGSLYGLDPPGKPSIMEKAWLIFIAVRPASEGQAMIFEAR